MQTLEEKRAYQRMWRAKNKKKKHEYYLSTKDQRREYVKAWREANRDKVNADERRRYANDPEKREKKLEANAKWHKANSEKLAGYSRKWRSLNPEKAQAAKRRWEADNYDVHRASENEYRRKHYAENGVSLSSKLRTRLRVALKGGYKSGSAVRDLGCTIEEFKQHLENHFQEGMTWENHGSYWHIDHIRPLCSFDLTDREQFLQACHWSNMQPLTAVENMSKGGKWQI